MFIKPKWNHVRVTNFEYVLLDYMLRDGSNLIIFKSKENQLPRQKQVEYVKRIIRILEKNWQIYKSTGAFGSTSGFVVDEEGFESYKYMDLIEDCKKRKEEKGGQNHVTMRDFVAEGLRKCKFNTYVPIVMREGK